MNKLNGKLTRRQVLGAAAAFCAYPCFSRSADSQNTKTPWTRGGVKGDGESFRFAVVADRTNNAREGVFEKALRQLECLDCLMLQAKQKHRSILFHSVVL